MKSMHISKCPSSQIRAHSIMQHKSGPATEVVGSANAYHISLGGSPVPIDVDKDGKGCEVCGGTHDTVPALHSSRKAEGGPGTVEYTMQQ